MSLIIILTIVVLAFVKKMKFKNSEYSQKSGSSFLETFFNKGKYGEFTTYSYLEKLKGPHKLLTNLYVPRKDGTFTEVDLVMIAKTGIYVFESKNYSGWIFGDEKNKNWVQTFKNNKKYRFFNPIWQNNTHINALKNVLQISSHIFKSYIVFSERCTLKRVTIRTLGIKVIKRNFLSETIEKDMQNSLNVLSEVEINQIYFKLKQYMNRSDEIRNTHLIKFQSKKNKDDNSKIVPFRIK